MQAEALPPLQILWFKTYPDMLSLKQRKCLTDLFSSFNLMTGLPAPHRAVANRYDWNERARMLFDVVGAKNPLNHPFLYNWYCPVLLSRGLASLMSSGNPHYTSTLSMGKDSHFQAELSQNRGWTVECAENPLRIWLLFAVKRLFQFKMLRLWHLRCCNRLHMPLGTNLVMSLETIVYMIYIYIYVTYIYIYTHAYVYVLHIYIHTYVYIDKRIDVD
jgi:hypothetical protein